MFLLSEFALRTYEYLSKDIPFGKNAIDLQDNTLGWEGKMIFGQSETNKFKVMIIGDSFTHGNREDEANMFYSIFKEKFDTELFIYGGPGYGTLQEYIILDKYLNEIRPDLIIVQLCSNDLINNDFELEKRSLYNNNTLLRPYLIDNEVRLRFPSWLGPFRYHLQSRSRVALRLFNISDRVLVLLASRGVVKSVEYYIEHTNNNTLANASQITSRLIGRITERAGNTPIIFMPVDTAEPYFSILKEIVVRENAIWIDEPAIEITRQISQNNNVRQEDGAHWNKLGHAIVGEALVNALLSRKILPITYKNIQQ